MENRKQLEVTIDLENYTVNITNIPGLHTCHIRVQKAEGRGVHNLLKGDDLPVKEGEVTWIKLFDLHPHVDNGLHEGDFITFVVGLDESGSEIAAGDSGHFHLTEGQMKFIKKTYATNHPPASPLSPRVEEVEDAAVEASDDTDEARNIQASPEIPPATTTDTDVEENLTEATPATEAPATDQPPTPPATVVPPMATPSPEEVAAYALEQMQKQLKEKDDAHVKELERVKAEKDAELERLQNARAAQTKQVAELQRVTSLAEQKLAAERATLQRAEREQRQRQEQEQAANAERQRLHEEEIANLRQLLAAVARVQQAQAANPAPAAAATQTPTPPTAAAGAAATEPDNGHRRKPLKASWLNAWLRWKPTGKTVLLIIAIVLAAGFIAWYLMYQGNPLAKTKSPSPVPDLATNSEQDKALREQVRLQEEINRMKLERDAAKKAATPTSQSPIILDTGDKTPTEKDTDHSLVAPSSIRDGARASVNMLNNGTFGDNARIEVNNKIDIQDNRQDNRQFHLDPDRWTKDWNPTLPWIEASDLPCGYSTILLPPREVQGIRLTPQYDVEVCSYDMPDIDVKIGTATHCYTYRVGPDGKKLKGSQMRICPKPHQSDVLVEILMIPPGGCQHPDGHPRQK